MLTDTPVKEALRQENKIWGHLGKLVKLGLLDLLVDLLLIMLHRKRKDSKQSRSNRKRQQQKTVVVYFVVNCTQRQFSREVWVQCTRCSSWAHEQCAGVEDTSNFTCHNCSNAQMTVNICIMHSEPEVGITNTKRLLNSLLTVSLVVFGWCASISQSQSSFLFRGFDVSNPDT